MDNNKKIIVNDKEYIIYKINAFKSARLVSRMFNLFAPLISSGANLENNEELKKAFANNIFIEENIVVSLIADLLDNIEYSNRKLDPDIHFSGDISSMIELCVEVVKYNNFLDLMNLTEKLTKVNEVAK